MKSILFTQCLQNDFVRPLRPDEPLPNDLHIGYSEAKRLVQSENRVGNIYLFLDNYYRERKSDHHAVHIRDWHSPDDHFQRDHLDYFGAHCIAGTEGARFIEQLENHRPAEKGDIIIDSTSLNDFVNTGLQQSVESMGIRSGEPWSAAIIGVWTDVKVQYLAYDLVSRFPEVRIALCSSLCASRSRMRHQWALEFMKQNLNVLVTDSINELLEFLNIRVSVNRHFERLKQSSLDIAPDTELNDEQRQVIRYLFRDSSRVELKKLGGGFSGAMVFAADSTDMNAKKEVPQVLKIDSNPKIGKERAAVESIENLLGPSSPRIKEFIHMEDIGGIRYFFANMNNTRTVTLQSILKNMLREKMSPAEKKSRIKKLIDEIDGQLFSRLYQNPVVDRANLFEYYDYMPSYAKNTLALIEKLLDVRLDDRPEITIGNLLPESVTFINPRRFYDRIEGYLKLPPQEINMTWVHGDLNLANLLSDDKNNFWMIDFYHTRIGHLMNDFAKLENDIKYIVRPLENEQSLQRAIHSDIRMNEMLFSDDALPMAEEDDWISFLILLLRDILKKYAFLRVRQTDYRIALLRYSAHTMTFDECSDLQKKSAAVATCMLAADIYRSFQNDIH